ncbi:O-antigen ligase family protein [Planctomycetota bacterium]|nr:O-antigen ligase family protein [Planctomycetota bacterium]
MTPRPVPAPAKRSSGESALAPRIDQVIEALILGLLLYLPLAFGGVMPISRVVIGCVGALISACFAIRCLSETDQTICTPRALLPIFGLVALAWIQIAELPAALVRWISPSAGQVWSDADGAAGADSASMTLSVYPNGTDLRLDLLVMGALLLLVSSTIYRDRAALRRLLLGVSLIGLLVSVVGIVHLGLGETLIYGVFEGGDATKGAPFAAYSHYAEFINLALGCGLGYLLIEAGGRARGRPLDIRDLTGRPGHLPSGLEKTLRLFLVIGVVAIVLSTSRNGLISMIFAASIAAAVMQYSRRIDGVGWSMAIAGIAATGVLLTLGVDPIIEKFEAVNAGEQSNFTTRLELIRDSASMGVAFAGAGAGLGAFVVAFPGFDTAVRSGTAVHAENQYLELFAEMGLPGAVLGLAFLVLLSLAVLRGARSSRGVPSMGLFGIVFGLSALGFHSLTDFGLVIPAVGLTAATLAGAALGCSGQSASASLPRRLFAGGSAATALTILAASVPGAAREATAWDHFSYTKRVREEIQAAGGISSAEQHTALVVHAALAAEGEPGNAEYRFQSALAPWRQAVAEAGGFDPDGPPVNPLDHPELSAVARTTVEELKGVLLIAPTHGPSWSAAGQLRRIWLNETADEAGKWILRGRQLTPHDPRTCLAAAFELMRKDREAEGVAEIKRAVSIGASTRSAVDLLAVSLDRPELALPFVEGDLGLTDRLISVVEGNEGRGELEAQLRVAYEELLVAACARPDAGAGVLLRLVATEESRGNLEVAAALLRRVLGLDPASRARLKYAKLLIQLEDPRGARRELHDLLNFHPGMTAASHLLEQLESDEAR